VTQQLAEEELAGLWLSAKMRLLSLAVVAALLLFLVPWPLYPYYVVSLLLFAAAGVALYLAKRYEFWQPWVTYAILLADFVACMVVTIALFWLLYPQLPPALQLRNEPVVYFFLVLTTTAFSYSPRYMLAAGLCAALAYAGGVWWAASLPGSFFADLRPGDGPLGERLALVLDPNALNLGRTVQGVVMLLLVACVLAAAVARSRAVAMRAAEAARQRVNLSRYFPPSLVETLVRSDASLSGAEQQPVAVLFADLVGFTRLAEQQGGARSIETLRQLHERAETAVFEHGGTLDKFLGDGIMATFGTPAPGPRDAGNALACARALLAAVDQPNRERQRAGEPTLRLSIGLHHGEVVIGNIGSQRRLELAVVGDVVNVASRLEEATRGLGCSIAISDAMAQAALGEAGADQPLAGFVQHGPIALRGREQPVPVWTYSPAAGPA